MIEKIVTKIISETLETEKYILLAQYHNKDNKMEFEQMNLNTSYDQPSEQVYFCVF